MQIFLQVKLVVAQLNLEVSSKRAQNDSSQCTGFIISPQGGRAGKGEEMVGIEDEQLPGEGDMI